MKKLITTIGVGLLIAFISPALAQKTSAPNKKMTAEERAQKRTDVMTKQLGLTKEQQEDVYKINLEHVKKMDELKAERKAQNEKTKAELNKVLTDEQKKKAEEIKKKREKKRRKK